MNKPFDPGMSPPRRYADGSPLDDASWFYRLKGNPSHAHE